MKVIKNVDTGDEPLLIRTITTTPREHFDGKWEPGRLYPLYSVVENNGTTFISQNGKMKEEPYVIYDAVNEVFKAPDGWKIKEMSADSRLTAIGGGSGSGVTPEEVEEMIAGKQDVIEDLSDIRSGAAAAASAYKKPSGGIPKTDMANAVQTSLGKADSAYQKPGTGIPFSDLAGGIQDSLSNADSAYQKPAGGIPASDLAPGAIPSATPISTDISADGTSDAKAASPKAVKTYVDGHTPDNVLKYTQQTLTEAQKTQARSNIDVASLADIAVIEAAIQALDRGEYITDTVLPTASVSTMGPIYLIGPDANNNYDRYFTQESGGAYSWVSLGSTQIDLSTYATKAEVSQLEAEVSDGITEYTYAYSKLTAQQPNISLGQDTQLYSPGDFVEIKANSNGATGVLLRRATAYNQPGVRYTASNTLVIRMTSAADNFVFQDLSVDANSVQTIKILVVSVSADFKNWGLEYYLDGTKIGDQTITTSGNTQYLIFIGQIGYDSVADIYYVKIKSNGVETEYSKLGEIQGAVGVTDIYTSESFDGLVGVNERLSVQEAGLAHLAEAVERAEGADMYFVFRKVSVLYNCESDFYVYQRLKGNIYSKIAIAFYISTGDKPNGYWRVERTNLVSLDEYGEETLIESQAIVAGENEFVLQWLAGSGYNYDGGYTGGFHYGETIKNVAGAWVEFVADGNIIDTSADIPLTPCKTFYYREYSPIYQHNDGTIAAWHLKETKFNDGGYEVMNDVKFIQALDYFAYPGIVCVSRYLSEYAMPENVATITDMGDGEPTQTEQFKSNGHRIHYEGNGYATDVFSEFRAGADDSLCQRVVYNSTAYNKYYRRNPDTPGSIDNRLVAFTKVTIKKM